MGVLSWNGSYRLAGAWVNPANGFNRSTTFRRDTTAAAWYEIARVGADVAN
jgi:hypothetical protein